MHGADVVGERRRWAFVAADRHGAFAGRERTHALVIGELVVSDVEPTAFVRALHPHRGEDDVHRHVPHVEATAACRWFPGRSTRQSAQARCPPLHCTNQSDSTSIKKPAPCSISRTEEVYSNLIHWRLQGAEAQGAVEQGEVHRDHRELHRRVLFRLDDLTLLVHNHLLLY